MIPSESLFVLSQNAYARQAYFDDDGVTYVVKSKYFIGPAYIIHNLKSI